MKNFIIFITKHTEYSTQVEANSLKEAEELAQNLLLEAESGNLASLKEDDSSEWEYDVREEA